MNSILRFAFALWMIGFALVTCSARADVVAVTDPATRVLLGEATLNGTVVDGDAMNVYATGGTEFYATFEIGTEANVYTSQYLTEYFSIPAHDPGGPIHFSYGPIPVTSGTTYHCRFSITCRKKNPPPNAYGNDVVFTPVPPTVTTLPATDITSTSAVLHGQIQDPSISASDPDVYYLFRYGSDASYADGAVFGFPDPARITPGAPVAIAAAGTFKQSTTVHYCLRAINLNSIQYVDGNDQVLVLKANTLPVAADASVVIGPQEGSIAIYPVFSDADSDAVDAVTITAVANPSGGSAAIDATGHSILYTKGTGFTGMDTFTYTVSDQYGGTATANITVTSSDRFILMAAGTYETNTTDEVQKIPSGTMRLTLDPTGAFTGSMDYFGASYSFKGTFQRDPNAGNPGIVSTFSVARTGLPPFVFHLDFLFQDGLPVLEGSFISLGTSNSLDPQTALLPPASAIPEAGKYTASLPPTSDVALPQGHGFTTIIVKPKGSVKFAGKTGDGTPFSRGTRMRRDRSVLISAKLGQGKQDRVTGGMHFTVTADTDCAGGFKWYRPQHPTGPYNGGFNYALNVFGSRFIAPPKRADILAFTDPLHPAVTFGLFDHDGTPLIANTVTVTPGGSAVATYQNGERLKINVDRRMGVFTGSLSQADDRKHPRNFSGVIVQKQKRGAGVGGKSGEDGRVEFVAQ